MNWDQLLSTVRFGQEMLNSPMHARTEFQRDYDRLIFSPAFRRLQNKTQVFPLPGSIFVHNRLTHSLEVSCVGRSLGNNASLWMQEKYAGEPWVSKLSSMDDIVASACLAHDMGNPPFGHSGERAFISYFQEGNGQRYRDMINEHQWSDLINFDGNANAFRLLTHQFHGRRQGGFALTYSTLASIIKYPYPSTECVKKSKYGYFEAEKDSFMKIVNELGILALDEEEKRYCRHPLVFLVEAADDICYQIMDIEDAHNLRLLSHKTVVELLLEFFEGELQAKVRRGVGHIVDENEQIQYLRSRVIGLLVTECSRVFREHEDEILEGRFNSPLITLIDEVPAKAYKHCTEVAFTRIYNSSDVVDIEVAGHQIISVLLDKFLDAVIHPHKAYSQLLLDRVPLQYEMRSESVYSRILAVLDYISGMTDVYALDLYRKIYGMSLPSL
ncbi:MAG: deoxyguanosinetriphosphate triphosphohydrolase [Bacteroidales bacterium]|nr:deoxyguanosinetriphosphate triphosphohydrolase [Bacteroidales bacterium]